MRLCDVLRMMVGGSGMTHREIATRMGRGGSYVSMAVSNSCNGGEIGVGRLVAIADACGYDVEVVSRETGERVQLSDA